jgi:hypothetical protein
VYKKIIKPKQWCDFPLLAVFIIIVVFLLSSGPSYPSSY